MANIEALFSRQGEIVAKIQQLGSNFSKDSAHRKTSEYLKLRLETLDSLWGEFESNNNLLESLGSRDQRYFKESIYERTKQYFEDIRTKLSMCVPANKQEQSSEPRLEDTKTNVSKIDELLSRQKTNFRALQRVISGIKVSEITEKWELDDELGNLQLIWKKIDKLHLDIDNILEGEDEAYLEEFIRQELAFKKIKRELNQKLSATSHLRQATPLLEIPVFTGKYNNWPTFFDLFSESIHNNNFLSKAQKMQHLKGKLKGEAERLIQHLNISAENYDIAWEILTHRYNNPHVLFTTQLEIFLNQPNVSKQSSYEIKRLYDTSTECVHAIHNLGVDTTTWDPILVHLICKKLDSDTLTDYKEARKSPRDLAALDELMTFLEGKYIALEPTQRWEKSPNTSPAKQGTSHQHKSFKYSYNKTPSKGYQNAVTSTYKCPYCNLDHELYRCQKFLILPADVKLRTVSKHQLCKNCLFKHSNNKCISIKKCKECNQSHHTILHDACSSLNNSSVSPSFETSASVPASSNRNISNKSFTSNNVSTEDEEVLLATVLLNVKGIDGNFVTLRCLLDQGSQLNLISETACQRLGLPRRKFSSSLTGVGISPKHSKGLVSLECQSIYNDYSFNAEAAIIPRLVNDLPNVSFSKKSWPHLQHMRLADPDYNISKQIDILLDAGVYSDIIMSGLVKGSPNSPIAQQTKLGWILSGNVKTFNCNVVINNLEEISKYWEMEEITNTASELSEADQYCEDHYKATTRRLSSGRYEVALPMKRDYNKLLGSSKTKAIAQFRQLESKLAKNSTFSESYKQFMSDFIQLNHMRLASSYEAPKCFLPHHGVIKAESTSTKLRVVFNAASKTSTGLSLNDLMECGPNLQQNLPTLILNWRKFKYVFSSDIQMMFRQILVRERDQPLQAIIWRQHPNEPLQEYLLTTVVYGTKAAPFLAMRTLRQIADDNAQEYPLAARALKNNCYMDDILCGGDTISTARELQRQLIKILSDAGMNLRKWSANDPQLLQDLSSEQIDKPFDFKHPESRKTLGLRWTPTTDSFSFSYDSEATKSCTSKRQLLSAISKTFDPLGWLSPLTIRAIFIFQKTWSSNIGWDDAIPLDIQNEWIQLQQDLSNINQFVIPRYVGNLSFKYVQLHGYCDASEKAYACVVYLVARDDKGEFTSRLVIAKTKLAPIKKRVSLPRLELCGALLLAQLIKSIQTSFSDCEIFAWTDSTVVLGWLHGDVSRWKQFVANRVLQITEIIPAAKWNHVRSEENAADCATRGTTNAKLKSFNLWWNGPEYLSSFDSTNYKNQTYSAPKLEVKKVNVNTVLQQPSSSFIDNLLNNNSSITRAAKILSWVLRFKSALRHEAKDRDTFISADELNISYNIIIKHVQAIELASDLLEIQQKGHVRPNSKLSNLYPYLDENGILRVGGRLTYADVSSMTKHPIILSSHGRFTDLVIAQAHIMTLHGGPRLTLSYIREKYWILSGMRTVKRQLRLCVKCRRFSTEKQNQIMADLPRVRVTPSRPFSNTGVDFTGHFYLKLNKGRGVCTLKGYVAVFICLATKAVHLELVTDLSTPAFLAAFRRFCARRGTPCRMYSDNGTNFVGAKRVLDKEYREIIRTINSEFFSNISDFNIPWAFSIPAWASSGGIWESAVKSLKRHLKRVLGEQRLTYEEFTTLLHQIEACLNSRPLYPLTENPDDSYLTPGHFLIGDSLLSRPQSDPDNISLPARWQLVQSMNKQFWKLWSADYLQHLQQRSKWQQPKPNLEINDVVLIREDNLPPGKWAMGRILEVHPGKDGFVRVVTIKTQSSILKRPITKLIKLPVKPEPIEDSSPSQSSDQPSAIARTRRKPKLFSNFLSLALLLFFMLISPSTQNNLSHTINQLSSSITPLNDSNSLYFDRISSLQHIRDEWRLVVYYNLTNYFQAIEDMETYIKNLSKMGRSMENNSPYRRITEQLQHELTEVEHYNQALFTPSHKREKRGLINGVGSVANYLFGVLDDNFAQSYAKDIEKLTYSENHLQTLIKNQTIIVEAEYNIVKRNEEIMNKQFTLIKEHLNEATSEINQLRFDVKNSVYFTSSALAGNIILEHLRRTQDSLINTITDISHGRFDTHLISIEQLEEQINFISNQLHGDLKLAVEKGNIRDLFKMIKVFAKIQKRYLIIEIKIPIISEETYELNKIISLPQKIGIDSFITVPISAYLAFSLRKEKVIFLSTTDLQHCLSITEDNLMCSLDKPHYDLDLQQHMCNITLANKITSPCTHKQVPCVNSWVKLHRQNVWLYSCCEQCNVRIFCPSAVSTKTMTGNGLFDIGQGCTLKSDSFTIYSHNNFLKTINIQPYIEAPEVSPLNTLINTSLPKYEFSTETHEHAYQNIIKDINTLKEATNSDLSFHDFHQYAVSYTTLGIALTLMLVAICMYARWRRSRRSAAAVSPPASRRREAPANSEGIGLRHLRSDSKFCVTSESEPRKAVSMSILSVDPPLKPPRSKSIPIPTESYSEIP